MNITRIKIQWVVNGQTVDLKHSLKQKLGPASKEALKAANVADRYVQDSDWHIRDANGVLLEEARKIEDFNFKPGARLFVSPAVGVGGALAA